MTSRPIQVECPEIDNPLPLSLAEWKTQVAVLSLSLEMLQCVNQLAAAASKRPGMECDELSPQDGRKLPFTLILSGQPRAPVMNCTANQIRARVLPHFCKGILWAKWNSLQDMDMDIEISLRVPT